VSSCGLEHVAQDSDPWRALVNTAMKLWVP